VQGQWQADVAEPNDCDGKIRAHQSGERVFDGRNKIPVRNSPEESVGAKRWEMD
jgi:hypothetical protein